VTHCPAMKRLTVLALALFLAGTGCAAGTSKSASKSGASKAPKNTKPLQHLEDVKITKCGTDLALGFAVATVTIKNSSSKESNYIVNVTFNSPDGKTQLGSGLAAANNLAAGQSATEEANALKAIAGKFACKVSDVTRYAS